MVENILISLLPMIPLYLGIYVVFLMRTDFDLGVAGTFGVGSAITAVMLVNNAPIWAAMVCAVLAAAALGMVTTGMYWFLGIPVFLGGLIMAISLYSVSLLVMNKQPTISLLGSKNLMTTLSSTSSSAHQETTIAILACFALLCMAAVGLFLKTRLGLALRVSGKNALMSQSNGFNDKVGVALSLGITNGLAGLSGSLAAQTDNYASVSVNAQVVIAGLGAVVIGAIIVRPDSSRVLRILIAVILGGLIYETVIVGALSAGIDPAYTNLVTGLTLVVAIIVQLVVRRTSAKMRGGDVKSLELFSGASLDSLSKAVGGE